jgi:hypothetical protein
MKIIMWQYEVDAFLMNRPQYHFYTTRSTNIELQLNNGRHNIVYNACIQESVIFLFRRLAD